MARTRPPSRPHLAGGLSGVHEGFSLWGRPALGSVEAELRALTAARSGGGRGGGVDDEEKEANGGGGPVDWVDGGLYFGTSADREWCLAGRFSLSRDRSEEEEEADDDEAAGSAGAGSVDDVGAEPSA